MKPEEAMKALREEVLKAVKIPVHPGDMSVQQKKLIILQMMMNYLEKYKPDLSFEKFKVRVLTRGDKQVYTGKTKGPVVRTPMMDDVQQKWVKLD